MGQNHVPAQATLHNRTNTHALSETLRPRFDLATAVTIMQLYGCTVEQASQLEHCMSLKVRWANDPDPKEVRIVDGDGVLIGELADGQLWNEHVANDLIQAVSFLCTMWSHG